MKQRKKVILTTVSVFLIIGLIGSYIYIANVKKNKKDTETNYSEFNEFVKENSYAEYLNNHKEAETAESEIKISGDQFSDFDGNVEKLNEYDGRYNVALTSEDGYIEYTVNIPKSAFYQIGVKYLTYNGNGLTVKRTLYIDGELPFEEAEYLEFERMFVDIKSEPAADIYGNDIKPKQQEKYEWQEKNLCDASGYYDEPLKFYLSAGEHKIRFKSESEPLLIDEIILGPQEQVPSYSEYMDMHKNASDLSEAETKVIQAEDLYCKSEKSNYPINDRTSASTQPQSAYALLLNTLGGTRWQNVGSSVSWKISVDKDGFYKIAPRYKQNYISGVKVYRKITIDGKLPFKEASNLSFDYAADWKCKALGSGNEDFLFYFEAGKEYTVEMEVVLGDMANILRRTQASLKELNSIYRKILMVTGASPDKYRDYNFETSIPDALEGLNQQAKELSEIKSEFEKVNGGGGERIAQISKLEQIVRRMADDSSEIAGKFSTFKDNVASLGTWVLDMSTQPLEFDYISIVPQNSGLPESKTGFFKNLAFQTKLFISSFVIDYSNMGVISEDTDNDKEIVVWISSGRDQMNTLRSLVNSEFTGNTGIKVELELVSVGTLLPSVLAGTGPDVALGNAIGDPINLALRNAAYDLSKFKDYNEVAKRFSEQSMVPYTYQGAVYALPETIQFNVMFYRKDILGELELTVPKTWNEWDSVISELSKKNMMVGLPHDQNVLLMMMYQMGSELYNNDGESVNLDSKEAYLSFEKLTEYYTLYDFDTEYDFVNRFRTGEMPLAISDYTVYNQLSLFAPEIQGDWEMALIPGTVKEDGSIDRTNTFSGTSTILLNDSDNPEASWEFMKWWSSEEVQSSYCNEMETAINASAKQPTANLEALKKLPWASSDLKTLVEAWNSLKGTPEVPGGYYVTRAYTFAFNQVINDSVEPSEALQKQIKSINMELTRKRREFGIKN